MEPAVPMPASGGVGTAAQLMQDAANDRDDNSNDHSNKNANGHCSDTDHDGRSANRP